LFFGTPSNWEIGRVVSITANAWHHICVSYRIVSATNFEFRCYVNGVLASTGTYTTNALVRTNSTSVMWLLDADTGANNSMWVDDIYIDDVSDLSDTGDIRVTAKRPFSNGGTNSFDTTTSTSSSGYGSGNAIYVNERPLVTTGARRHNATSTAAETFGIEGVAAGDVDLTGATIVGRQAWVHASGVSTDTIYSDGTPTVPTVGNGAISGSAGYRWTAATTSAYPSDASAVGMGRPTGNATDAVLNEAGMLLAYRVPTTDTVRPIADVTAGTWTPISGSVLWDMLDDASDATYIRSAAGAGPDICAVRLGPMTDPDSAAVTLTVRHRETP
jgi:hypothetical protein